MNYCNPLWNGNGHLSFTDIMGVQRYYRSGKWVIETGTLLRETGNEWQFSMGDINRDGRDDLIGVQTSGTYSGRSELHILSGEGYFQSWLNHIILPTNTGKSIVLSGDVNGDGFLDLMILNQQDAGANATAVHVLCGKTNFQHWVTQRATALHQTDSSWSFALGHIDNDHLTDLVAVHRGSPADVHILSGKSSYQDWILQTVTPLNTGHGEWSFSVADMNGDGHGDLVAIHKSGTPTEKTELHILAGPRFDHFIIQTPLQLGETDDRFEFFAVRPREQHYGDVAIIQKRETGTRSTEVHIVDGAAYLP